MILIVAGEASGDNHGAALVEEIRKIGKFRFIGIGGDRMKAAGVELLYSLDQFAVMGFSEVLWRIPFFIGALRKLTAVARNENAGLFIAVDFPGFNLRMCGRMKKLGIPVVYYISPQVWAWGEKRVKEIGENVDRMLVIFPFEEEFYRKRGVAAEYVGHPLAKKVVASRTREEYLREKGLDPGKTVIGLLPGSRLQEIRRIFPEMAGAAKILVERNPGIQFVLGAGASFDDKELAGLAGSFPTGLAVERAGVYDMMAASDVLLVTSGTATLEAALLGKPMVILYKTSILSWLVAKLMVKLPYIGLANIVAGKKVVPELLQNECRPEAIASAAQTMLRNKALRAEIEEGFSRLRTVLGERDAPSAAAGIACTVLRRDAS